MFIPERISSTAQEMSFDEFMAFDELPENAEKRHELIGGYVVAMSAPILSHQMICGRILMKIDTYLEGKTSEVFQYSNVYLFKEDIGKCENVYRPDLMVGCDVNKMKIRAYEGSPEWIIEVVSKSTGLNDYITKCGYYMEYGVKEYWIVDLYADQILVYLNREDDTPIVQKYSFQDKVKVSIFDDLCIDFKEVLASLPSSLRP